MNRTDRESAALSPAPGFVAAEVAAEFPGLRLDWATVTASPRASPPAVVQRLRELSNRYRGGAVVTIRTKPIPHAFRSFFRQIGLDPDVHRIPTEAAAVARLFHGGFRSVDVVTDACLVALIETGIPVWALDADVVDERGLGIRTTTLTDCEGADAGTHPGSGSLAVADGSRVHAALFGNLMPGHGVAPATTRVALFSVAVAGVPAIHVEEALWLCLELLAAEQ